MLALRYANLATLRGTLPSLVHMASLSYLGLIECHDVADFFSDLIHNPGSQSLVLKDLAIQIL
jgi:hypothetical protein